MILGTPSGLQILTIRAQQSRDEGIWMLNVDRHSRVDFSNGARAMLAEKAYVFRPVSSNLRMGVEAREMEVVPSPAPVDAVYPLQGGR